MTSWIACHVFDSITEFSANPTTLFQDDWPVFEAAVCLQAVQ